MTGHRIDALRAARIAGPGAEHLFDDEPVDILVRDGVISDIAPTGTLRLEGEVLDAEGTWVVPGLWDNHVHTVQWALCAERVPLTDASTAVEAAARMSGALPLADGRRVGSGFRDALWPDAPALDLLDAATGGVPTYLINADVHSVWLNSAALSHEGMHSPDGVLREHDAFEISRRLNAVAPDHADRAVGAAAGRAAARGITGIVDLDMAWNAEAWARRSAAGFDAHRVEFGIYPDDLDRAVAEGLRTGDALGDAQLIRVGALKVITDGSLGTRTAACSHPYGGQPVPGVADHGVLNVAQAELTALLTRATGAGLAAAVHAIGDRAVSLALDAFAATGAEGTLEHAQLMDRRDILRLARLGLTASIQPQHALDDRELVSRLWADQSGVAYPMASLLSAGATVRLGSDAPVSPLDPWFAMAAAVSRTDDEREPWHPEERLSIEQALVASTRTATRPGEPADLVLCAEDPRTADAAVLRRMPVTATILAGRVTYAA